MFNTLLRMPAVRAAGYTISTISSLETVKNMYKDISAASKAAGSAAAKNLHNFATNHAKTQYSNDPYYKKLESSKTLGEAIDAAAEHYYMYDNGNN